MKRKLFICFYLFSAINLTGIGVVLFLRAGIGSDTITVFVEGLSNLFNCSIGTASRIYNIIVLLFALVLSRKDIGWLTVIYALSVGVFIDFYFNLTQSLFIDLSTAMKVATIVIGQLCLGLSFAILIKLEMGMSQLDAISYGIARKTKISYKLIRTSIDVILLILGWLLGGVVGVGSLFAMATTGITIEFFLQRFTRIENSTKSI